MSEDRKSYFEMVAVTADDIVLALDVDDERDLDEQMMSQIQEVESMHPWIIDEDKAILILRVSDHPTAEFFHHGTPIKGNETQHGKASFPFSTCAASALVEDVKNHLLKHHGFDGPINAKTVKRAQAKMRSKDKD